MQLDAAGSLALDFTLETGQLTEEVTVTAEQSPLQSDVALRKTIEAKDIEQIAFNGRNPIGVAGLKAGVVGGSFNNNSFSSLTNGGFSINGSRGNENNITVDGATAIRTRASGAIIGVQNVDTIQEIQVLTGDYMPEYGRVERRPDPHRHEERQQPLQRERVVLHTATTRCRRTRGDATGARTRSRTAGRPRSTTSSTRTRSVGPFRWVS